MRGGGRIDPTAFRRKVKDLKFIETTGRKKRSLGRGEGGGGELFRLVPDSGTFDRRI